MYVLQRNLLFMGDPETMHNRVLYALSVAGKSSFGRSLISLIAGACPASPLRVMGLDFKHPIGLAAGFDKDARALPALFALNFSFVEIGTVTPRPQPGNPKPRIWRFPEADALVNAMGFPGEGMLAARQRLERLRNSSASLPPVGINIGKNAATPLDDALSDYKLVLTKLLEFGDYFVVNVSSPNTPGLRTLQEPDSLRKLLAPLLEITQGRKPLLLKIAPDLANDDIATAARVVNELGLAGMVCANTSIRRELVPRAATLDRGGLSGSPIFPRMLECVRLARQELDSSRIVIAAGGIDSAERARQTLDAGAALLQLYTAFIFQGPRVVKLLMGK
ncbi:MAG: quinone-dependent dihydroorotate dehydrogenase [Calditrichaeota bacterium]|nr:quinone-dependent dihydroorotate dehydrogenase [Calditrichota bacterium]